MSDHIELSVMKALCKRARTSYSKTLLEHLVRGDQKQLLLIEKPSVGSSAEEFAINYMLYSYLRKWTGLETGIDTRSVAIDNWKVAESKCAETNRNVELILRDTSERTYLARRRICAVQRKIESVLGSFPKVSTILESCRWSNGASFDLRRGAIIAEKISSARTVTREALKYAKAVLEADPHWVEVITGFYPEGPVSLLQPCEVVQGSRFLTVPKDAKTDRSIAAEPTMNTFLQQSVGSYIRRRLKRFGVDLDDQSRNQKLAFEALADDLATLDLSMASDTISKSVVFALLPPAWVDFLDDLRSKYTRLDGEWVYLSKFSSMGNSFTFELESLLFWAIAEVGSEEAGNEAGPIGIFGDDIIVPQNADGIVREILTVLGFSVNAEKSFSAGSVFFESCGKHYHSLEDVTPVYQKALVGRSGPELVRMHNRLCRWAARNLTDRFKLIADGLILIRAYAERCIKGELPEQPPLMEGDFGFITYKYTNRPYVRSYGRRYRVYQYHVPLRVIEDDSLHLSQFAYKLRRPSLTNSHPKGYFVREGKGFWKLRFKFLEDPTPLSD